MHLYLHRAAFGVIASWPALAAAQAKTQAAPHWAALWVGPILAGGVLLLLALRSLHRWRVLRAIGALLWLMVVTAGGSLALYALPKVFASEAWYLPLYVAGLAAFVVAGEHARRKLAPPMAE